MDMPIIPDERNRVLPHRRNLSGTRRLFEHGQQRGRFGRLPELQSCFFAVFVAVRARTRVAQVLEGEDALMPVFPIDFHALAAGLVHADGPGLGVGGHMLSITSSAGRTCLPRSPSCPLW